MVHRVGMHPRRYITESSAHFRSLQMRASDLMVHHYMPDSHYVMSPTGEPWRGGQQRGQAFLGCFVELLCRPSGICLELGCGTAPILSVCLATGRACASIDIDEPLISSHVQRLLHVRKQSREESFVSRDVDDEAEMPPIQNPFDD